MICQGSLLKISLFLALSQMAFLSEPSRHCLWRNQLREELVSPLFTKPSFIKCPFAWRLFFSVRRKDWFLWNICDHCTFFILIQIVFLHAKIMKRKTPLHRPKMLTTLKKTSPFDEHEFCICWWFPCAKWWILSKIQGSPKARNIFPYRIWKV